MKSYLKVGMIVTLAMTLASIPVRNVSAAAEDEDYMFKVHNTTKDTITKLLASEDGKEYGSFDVGKEGIAPGQTITLKWDKKTNESGCKWFIKAVFEDGSDTPAKKFDFCEEDLELEF